MVTLSDSRMLSLWRSGAGLEPALVDASIERFDSLDVDDILRIAMRCWYLDLLFRGDLSLVPVTDITERVSVTTGAAFGVWSINLPPDTARLVSLEIADTGQMAILNPDDPAHSEKIAEMANRFVRAGRTHRAIYRPGLFRVIVYSNNQPRITALRAVLIPDDDSYVLHERALAEIPQRAMAAIERCTAGSRFI